MKLFYWLATAILALVLVVFAVSNRDSVTLTLWPLPITVEAPTYLIVLLTLLAGFLIGELAAWINGHRRRNEMRRMRRRIETLEGSLAARGQASAVPSQSPAPVMRDPSRAVARSRPD